MVILDSDRSFGDKHYKAIIAALREYKDITGECFPPFNHDICDYKTLEDWYKGLLAEIDRLKQS